MKVQVCIVGGGPSGLLLSQLLHLQGIDTVVLERHSRDYVLSRIRAGVLEQGFAEAAARSPVRRASAWTAKAKSITAFTSPTTACSITSICISISGGNSVLVYGQTEVTRDLYEARDRLGGKIVHDAEDVTLHWPRVGCALCHLSPCGNGHPRRLRLRGRRRWLPWRQP